MNKKIITFMCLSSVFLSTSLVHAQTGIESTGGTVSVKDSSDRAMGANQMGQIMSQLTAGVLFSEAAKHFSRCGGRHPGECVRGAIKAGMGALSMKQAAANRAVSMQAFDSSLGTDGLAYHTADVDPYGLDNPNNPLLQDAEFRALKSNMANLEKGVDGSKLDLKNGTIKTADGKTYKVSDFGSAAAMSAAGLSTEGLSDLNQRISKTAQEKMDKLKLGSLTESAGYEEGGARSVGSGSGLAAVESTGASLGSGNGRSLIDRDPSSVAGMQKNYNGEPIGVAGDSIFLMMNRRYKLIESQDSFFSDADLALQK